MTVKAAAVLGASSSSGASPPSMLSARPLHARAGDARTRCVLYGIRVYLPGGGARGERNSGHFELDSNFLYNIKNVCCHIIL
jgi:hypothetical protein